MKRFEVKFPNDASEIKATIVLQELRINYAYKPEKSGRYAMPAEKNFVKGATEGIYILNYKHLNALNKNTVPYYICVNRQYL